MRTSHEVQHDPARAAQGDAAQAGRARIKAKFPDSGLSRVAAELVSMVEEAGIRAEAIHRPNWPLRVGVVLLSLGAGAGPAAGHLVAGEDRPEGRDGALHVRRVGAAGLLLLRGGGPLFGVAGNPPEAAPRLSALHELRAMAHVVEMHQIAKDPVGLLAGGAAAKPDGREQTTKTPEELNRYLNYCNELLSIISKIAALYVQDFPDAPTVGAEDQVENLCSGISHAHLAEDHGAGPADPPAARRRRGVPIILPAGP